MAPILQHPIVRHVRTWVRAHPKEFGVLAHLLRRAGSVITRAELAEQVWEDLPDTPSNVIEVTVYHLREKIDRGHPHPLIHTVRGAGYVLKAS